MTTAEPIQRSATLWRQIKAELLQDLSSGIFGPGDRLPGEHALAERFGTTRNTVRRALSELEAAGMLRIVHGGGCFVRDEPVDYGIGDRTRFTQNLLSQNRYSARRVLSARTEPATAAVAGHLHLETGAPVIVLDVLAEADDRMLSVGSNHYDAVRFDGIAELYRETGSFTDALARLGIEDYWRQETALVARMPTQKEARLLRQSRLQPVIEQQKVDVDRDGRPIAFGISVFAAARVRFVVRRGNRVDGDGDWSRRPAAARDEPYPSSPGIR